MGAAKKEEMYCSEVGVAAAAAKERETALYNTLPCTLPSKQDIKRKGGIIKDERDERESVGRKIGAWSHLRPAIGRKRKERGQRQDERLLLLLILLQHQLTERESFV